MAIYLCRAQLKVWNGDVQLRALGINHQQHLDIFEMEAEANPDEIWDAIECLCVGIVRSPCPPGEVLACHKIPDDANHLQTTYSL